MSEMCALRPSVSRKVEGKVEEKESQLFRDIKKAVQDDDTAWEMWAFTKTPVFKATYKDVEYDEWGEVTFSSLIKALKLEKEFNAQKDTEDVAKEYGITDEVITNPDTAVSKINEFNAKEDRFVAVLVGENGGHRIEVLPRNGANMERARKQSYNKELTGEIIRLLQSIGFNVDFINDPKFAGLFDPENATLENGLITIIRIARGEEGEEALPEEFSHLIIEGLINHPLVQRLLASIDDALIKEVLGDSYEQYAEEYKNDPLRMRKEVAGQLLAEHIKKQGTIKPKTVEKKKGLLSRVWSWAKNKFSKITGKQISDARERAHDAVNSIYSMITTGDAIPLIDKHAVLEGADLYRLSPKYPSMEHVSNKMLTVHAKIANRERMDSKTGNVSTNTADTNLKMQKMHEGGSYAEAVMEFLTDTKERIDALQKKFDKLKTDERKRQEEEGVPNNIVSLKEIAKVVREIDEQTQGYLEALNIVAKLDPENCDIDDNQASVLTEHARHLISKIDALILSKQDISRNILYNAARTVYVFDKVRGIGSKRDQVMRLETILDHADRDINVIDRWLSAMSDADDALLTIFDQIVKNQQYERDLEMAEWEAKIALEDKKLRDAGFSSDFMYERDENGVPTVRLISPYDWVTYNNEKYAYIKEQRQAVEEGKMKMEEYRKKIKDWKYGKDSNGQSRTIRLYVDPEVQKRYENNEDVGDLPYDEVPNPKRYDKYANRIENLAPAQKAYYNEMMRIKRTMMTKIPHRGQAIYRTIFISKDFIEGIIGNTTGSILKATKEHYVKKFVRRPDDIGFGIGSDIKKDIMKILKDESDPGKAADKIVDLLIENLEDEYALELDRRDIIRVIKANKEESKREIADKIANLVASSNFYFVETNFAGERIQRLPIYYSQKLKDMSMLSTDFSSSLLAYSAMAVNYEKMDEVIDILEVGRDYIKNDRTVRIEENGNPMMTAYQEFGKKYKSFVEKSGVNSSIAGRLNDYMDAVVYEERKANEGNIYGTDLDFAKTLDTIKDYSGLIGLGLNLFSTVSNIMVGKLQQWIEAAGGEYFNVKDYAKAVGQYTAMLPEHLAEISSPVKKSKLSLLIRMFDPMGEYYGNLRDVKMAKNIVTRFMGGNTLAYIGMNAGEHLLHCQTMLAILNHIKLTNSKTGEKISLFDALKVVEGKDGIHRLQLDPDLEYERELVDNTGTPENNKNYGKPVRDENGKIQTEVIPLKGKEVNKFIMKKKKVIRKVNDSLNGAFSENDKGAAHRYAVLRLVLQFRQWMPAHYMRRFARAHYDADLEQWREGYYTTVAKIVFHDMRKDTKKALRELILSKELLSEHERANLRRAYTEISLFYALFILCKLGGRVKDRDRSWLDKMALYQINRMKLEIGSSMPGPAFFSNLFQLMQSPAAAVKTMQNFSKILNILNMFEEVQTGRYQGWSEWGRDAFIATPLVGQVVKAIDFDDSMFSMYEND